MNKLKQLSGGQKNFTEKYENIIWLMILVITIQKKQTVL